MAVWAERLRIDREVFISTESFIVNLILTKLSLCQLRLFSVNCRLFESLWTDQNFPSGRLAPSSCVCAFFPLLSSDLQHCDAGRASLLPTWKCHFNQMSSFSQTEQWRQVHKHAAVLFLWKHTLPGNVFSNVTT